ncbi:putative lactonase drp35 [Aaosphaeria arxii CBS 175.79]|uniref:Putative lactonase drp35 n=1 Tax=Aaosphaeria arxii CBS 175.79 TaxID=1450172 RepID=A0A6A5XQC1_9PLEO|nr:putative lactonase drp35 [Aaosphaeria arxii CBS 175.79]KAF2015362.1 putative lactonase drp35 [Aaosphaeria arxii CBS 175.79]
MFYLDPPIRMSARLFTTIPKEFSKPQTSEWAYHNMRDRAIGSFLEGPCFDDLGNLLVTDIPFGRIFRICPQGNWSLLAEYKGWPNGLKRTTDGRVLVADHLLGLVEIKESGEAEVVLSGYRGERFRGLNDLTIGANGWVYFTDQGQSGLQEPNGCIYRWHTTSQRLERVASGIPSPNGLALSTDETRLFVAVTRTNTIWRIPFVLDGGVSKVGVYLNLSGGNGPDGLAIDNNGGLVVAQPGLGVLRFDSRGMLTHVIELPDGASCSNIAFEGMGSKRMVIVDSAWGNIYEIDMPFASGITHDAS